mmetsp:Transcript_5650/g.23474  ORF Transcript_5650/g.23474 Transcript_5650/m.23474 type:complete len:207 (-) Transcript_5650:72-692(-)
MTTEMMVMTTNAPNEPANARTLDARAARIDAMKNVLSPISERKISDVACKNTCAVDVSKAPDPPEAAAVATPPRSSPGLADAAPGCSTIARRPSAPSGAAKDDPRDRALFRGCCCCWSEEATTHGDPARAACFVGGVASIERCRRFSSTDKPPEEPRSCRRDWTEPSTCGWRAGRPATVRGGDARGDARKATAECIAKTRHAMRPN